MKNASLLQQRLKQLRDDREKFYLQESNLIFKVSEKLLNPDPQLQDKISSINSGNGFKQIELLTALFGAFDITAYISGELEGKIPENVKILFDRILQSQTGSILVKDITSDPKASNPFSLKVVEDGIHEMFVSFFATNRLRKIVPNVQLCYAGIKATTPSNPKVETSTSTCPVDTPNHIDYLVMENLQGTHMTQALKTCSLQNFLSWFIQIILTLEIGTIHFGFTHNNLNPDNILIVPSGSEVSIRYFHRNNNWVLTKVSSFAMIGNFEMAHIKHKHVRITTHDDSEVHSLMYVNRSEHFGPIGYDHQGIYYNETRPFYDIYKIMMWSLRILKQHNHQVFESAWSMSKFFGVASIEELEKTLMDEERLSYIYSSKVTDDERVRSISELLAIIGVEFQSILDPIFRKETSFQMLKSVVDCSLYCSLKDSSNVVKKSENDFLKGWGLREVMERYEGLSKRSKEFGKMFPNGSEESVLALREFQKYRGMISERSKMLISRSMAQIDELRLEINEMIRLANLDVIHNNRSYYVVCRDREMIKNRLIKIVSDVSWLLTFIGKFEPEMPIPKFEVDSLMSYEPKAEPVGNI